MTGHVDQARNSMFNTSADNVKKQLSKMLRDVEEAMSKRADEVFFAMRRDYRSILGGEDMPQGEVMPKWAKEMRRKVSKLIDGVEERFTKIEESNSKKIKHEDLEMDTTMGDEHGKGPAEGDKESKEEEANPNGVEIKGNVSDDQPMAIDAASNHKLEEVNVDNGTSRTVNDGNLLEGLDKQNDSGQLLGDTEMVDVQPTTTPQAVEDSYSSSPVENVVAVQRNGTSIQENGEQAGNMDGNKKAFTKDFKDILDW